MICPTCKHTDFRDMGVVRGVRVYLCRHCGAWLRLPDQKLTVITDKKVLGALV